MAQYEEFLRLPTQRCALEVLAPQSHIESGLVRERGKLFNSC